MSNSRKFVLALGVLSGLIGLGVAFSGDDRDTQLLALGLVVAGVVLALCGKFFGRP